MNSPQAIEAARVILRGLARPKNVPYSDALTEAARIIDREMSPPGRLSWTDETPTQLGAYWLRMHGFPDRIVHVVNHRDELRVCLQDPREFGIPLSRYATRANFRWAGPIPPPEGGNDHVPAPGDLI